MLIHSLGVCWQTDLANITILLIFIRTKRFVCTLLYTETCVRHQQMQSIYLRNSFFKKNFSVDLLFSFLSVLSSGL
jgi:hypothetical protein